MLLAAIAMRVVLRPQSVPALLTLAAAVLIHIAVFAPYTPNHRILHGLVALSFLGAAASIAGQHGIRNLKSDVLFRSALPTIRAIVIILYVFVFFAKLNTDFLDPTVSCATRFFDDARNWLPWLPHGPFTERATIFSTILVEALLPPLLYFRRTRTAGVFLGIAFHFVLSFDVDQNLVNFSSAMSAFLVLFLPDAIITSPTLPWRAGLSEKRLRTATAAVFLMIIAAGLFQVDYPSFTLPYYFLRETLFTMWVMLIVGGTIALLRSPRAVTNQRLHSTPIQWAIIALALLIAFSPYLGLRTRGVFTMYSNLWLDGSGSNHLIVPRSLDLLGILSDRVTIIESSSGWVTKHGNDLPWFEVARLVTRDSPLKIRYRRDHTEYTLLIPNKTGEVDPPPWFLRKLLRFHAYGKPGACYF